MNIVAAFKNAVRANDSSLIRAYASDLRKEGLSDRAIYRIALSVNPDLSWEEFQS